MWSGREEESCVLGGVPGLCITSVVLQQPPDATGTDPGDLQLQKQKCSHMTEGVRISENRVQTQTLHIPDLLRLKSKFCRKMQSVLRYPPSGKTGSGFGVD